MRRSFVLCLTLAAAVTAQRPSNLRAGTPVEFELPASKTTSFRINAPKNQVATLLVSALDGATDHELEVTVGGKPFEVDRHQFKTHTVLEWLNTGRSTELSVRGREGQALRVKLRASKLPVLAAPKNAQRPTTVSAHFPLAIAPTAWFRLPVSAKEWLRIRASGFDVSATGLKILGAKGVKTHAEVTGTALQWTAKQREAAVLKVSASNVQSPAIQIERHKPAEDRLILRMPEPIEIVEDEIDDQEGLPVRNYTLEVKGPQGAEADMFLEDAGTYVIETVGGSLKDPALTVSELDADGFHWDDDSGDGSHARLEVTLGEDTVLEVRIHGFDPNARGRVTLRVSRK